ncbi:MAG: T9SS type A sorting domain-containing protein, partial [Bacteroidales bacterium]|nr:T9SS type A sorting domain-containing protein [Bacteroidales bacterium]
RNGQHYNTVQIGDQCWMAENLNIGIQINGTVSMENNEEIEKYCYDDDPANCEIFGGLYRWDEMMQYTTTEGVQGICMQGWHLPTDGEWTILTTFLGGEGVAGGKMKDTTHWIAPNTGATNESGFTALPGGINYSGGVFNALYINGMFWSSSQPSVDNAWDRNLYSGNASATRQSNTKINSFSVRCLMDENQPPEVPSNPNPIDGAINQPINTFFSWFCTDPNGDPLTYDVYIGTTNPPGNIVSTGQSETTYDPGLLEYEAEYFWKIVAYDNHGNLTVGPVWSFLTEDGIWECGETFIDARDGQEYETVQIDQQCWLAENLAYLPSVSPSAQGSETEPYFYVYGYQGAVVQEAISTDNYINYGVLYNWPASMESCPDGWHIPSDNEWDLLINHLGGTGDAGGAMKSTMTEPEPHPRWKSPNTGATNSSGFTGFPGGYRINTGDFLNIGNYVHWWSSTAYSSATAWKLGLNYNNAYADMDYNSKWYGFSVRCLIGTDDLPPNPPSNPIPENGSNNQTIEVDLGWTCSDPNGDQLTYDVFFGEENPPEELVSTGQSETTYDPGVLEYETEYFWKIIAYDNHNNSTEGTVWSFTTEPMPCEDPIADAGDNVTICEDQIMQLNGQVENACGHYWSTNVGDGTFDNNLLLDATYTPGTLDIVTGYVELCHHAEPCSPCTISDTDCMTLTIHNLPDINLGIVSAIIYESDIYTFTSVVASNYSTLLWSTNGDGTFNDPGILNPVYTPGPLDIENQEAELCLTAVGQDGCPDTSSCIELTILNQDASVITSIYDIPDDQGGWVYIDFLKSIYDTDTLRGTESYTVQRYDEDKWVSLNSMSAYGQDEYTVEARTLKDSSYQSNGMTTFRIIAGMDEGNWASTPDSGYSVDNLAPFAPDDFKGYAVDNSVHFNWSEPVDEDFQYFAIYKTDEDGQFGDEPFATIILNHIVDEFGLIDYNYKITAFDFNGNESQPSKEITSQSISLNEGWSGISGYIIPDFPVIETVFESIENELIILQNLEGVYWPGQNVNTLFTWDENSGYFLKVSDETILPIVGNKPDQNGLLLSSSWSLIPVLSECEVDVAELFGGTDVKIIKEVAGYSIYWPEFGINTLEYLQPGKAYFVLMEEDAEIIFPECLGLKHSASRNLIGFENLSRLNTLWQLPISTVSSHTIAIPTQSIKNSKILSGDFIGAFDETRNCLGVGFWQGKNISITIFGDDPTTPEKDGFTENEPIKFRLWKAETQEDYILDVTFDPSMPNPEKTFANHGLSAISLLKISNNSLNENAGSISVQIIPNPAKDEFLLSFDQDIAVPGQLTIFKLDGQIVRIEPIPGKQSRFDISRLTPGVYLLHIEINGTLLTKRLIRK